MPDQLDEGRRRRGRVKPGTTATDTADLREARKRIGIRVPSDSSLRGGRAPGGTAMPAEPEDGAGLPCGARAREAGRVTPLWVPLVVAGIGLLGTVIGTIAKVLIAQRRSDRREVATWQRERIRQRELWQREDALRNFEHRREAYVSFHESLRDGPEPRATGGGRP